MISLLQTMPSSWAWHADLGHLVRILAILAGLIVILLALILFVVGGAIAFGLLAFVPSLRDKFLRTYTERGDGRGTALAIGLLACLMLTTHLCVYISIVKAPNAGYAQAIVNVSALLIALILWATYRQELSLVALAGIALITIGSGMLKVGM